jgi:hypothetical protein
MELSDFINLPLLAQPYNWVVVILILTLVVMVLCLIASPLGQIGGLVTAA